MSKTKATISPQSTDMPLNANGQAEPIAITGIGCRFPGAANDPESFWNLLCDGVDPITEIPQDRWNLQTFHDEDRSSPGRMYTKWGGFVDSIDQFDAEFFRISPREAACMDPQQRMLLETSWEALEDAGEPTDALAGSPTGVFIGLFTRDYQDIQFKVSNRRLIDAHTGTGVSMSIAANRISYVFDFVGPSIAVDTACSSSMVAIHMACQSLRNRECNLALAGGANAILSPEMTLSTSKASMLSPTGRCHSFDARADGYVRAEGAGVIVLKPLSAAIDCGDRIYAVIRGSAVNQDGRSKALTVPKASSQVAALKAALDQADVEAQQIRYVEAHGTGTPIGDPVETAAIGSVFGQGTGGECLIGSVKSNIGHMEAGAGVAGVIKVALALSKGQLPPTLHFETPNPDIAFGDLGLRVVDRLEPWPTDSDTPRKSCVNSFGFGGTNATAVLEQMISPDVEAIVDVELTTARLVPLSARGPEALEAVARNMLDYCDSTNDSFADICATLSLRRSHHDDRIAVVAQSNADLAEQIEAYLAGETRLTIRSGLVRETPLRLAFVFSGMGTQWWGMARELLENEPVFRDAFMACDQLLLPMTGWSVHQELQADQQSSRINETRIAQPAIFSVQVGLAALWKSWGIEPQAIVGHSVGEVAAAHVSGALSLAHAACVVYHRSRLQQQTAGGGRMLAVGLPEDAAQELLDGRTDKISIGAVNSQTSTTLAGDEQELESIATELNEKGVFCRLLEVEVPYHSPKMDRLQPELLESLKSIEPRPTCIDLYSSVTGKLIEGERLDASYWFGNLRQTVRFADTVKALADARISGFLEIGPHPVLSRSITECLSGLPGTSDSLVLCSLRRGESERATLLSTLGELYTSGYPIDWSRLVAGRAVRLPTYPWQRDRYWQESEDSLMDRIGEGANGSTIGRGETLHPLLGGPLGLAPSLHVWEVDLDDRLAYLEDHAVHSAVIYPGAAYIETGLAIAAHLNRTDRLENIEFHRALVVAGSVRLQTVLHGETYEIYSRVVDSEEPDSWRLHASGRFTSKGKPAEPTGLALAAIQSRSSGNVSQEDCYRWFGTLGLNYGRSFQGIEHLWFGGGEALARFRQGHGAESGYRLHPVLLDSCLQVLIGTLRDEEQTALYMPVRIDSLTMHEVPDAAATLWCHARLLQIDETELRGDIRLMDETGRVLLQIDGMSCRSLAQSREPAVVESGPSNWLLESRWIESSTPSESKKRSVHSGGKWLVLADRGGVGAQLAAQLEDSGRTVVVVSSGESLTPVLESPGARWEAAVHCWSLDTAEPDDQTWDAGLHLGCSSVVQLVQSLSTGSPVPRLLLVTRGAQPVSSDRVSVAQAPLWGLGQVVALEHPQLRCTLIDLDLDNSHPTTDAQAILEEVESIDKETRVARRKGRRLVARVRPFDRKSDKKTDKPLVSDGSYLITGGLGGLGLECARFLIEKGARHLVLASRSGAAGKEAAVGRLESTGARVMVVKANVSKPEDVSRLLDEIDANSAPLRGIFHVAGLLDDGILRDQTPERFSRVMDPKARGAWNLHGQTLQCPLDFFVCFSSVASLLGSLGQGNYAAANAFMDALAHHRHSLGLPAQSINWGPWARVGMASSPEILKHLSVVGLEAIDTDDALMIFDQLISTDVVQVGVAPIDWSRFFSQYPKGIPPFFENFADQAEQPGIALLEQLKAAPEGQRRSLLDDYLRDQLAGVLGIASGKKIRSRQRLLDLGLDSLMAVQLQQRLESDLSTRFPTTLIFEHPTVGALGDHLAREVLESPESVDAEKSQTDPERSLDDLDRDEIAGLLAKELNG